MMRAILAAVLCAASSIAFAQPAKMTDSDLASVTAGSNHSRVSNNTTQIASSRSLAVAVCVQCSNTTVQATAIAIASNSNTTNVIH
jgi:hypothetical protein